MHESLGGVIVRTLAIIISVIAVCALFLNSVALSATSSPPEFEAEPTTSSPETPMPPDALTITSVTPSIDSLSVSFTGPTNGADVQYIRVTVNGVTSVALGTTSPLSITGLTPDTEYTVSILAGNPDGDGAASAPWTGRTLGAPAPAPIITAPSAPGITLGTISATVAEWTVEVPASSGGEAPTVYTSGIEGRGESSFNPEQRRRSVSGLRPNTTYTIIASARNVAGSSPSTRTTFRTPAAIPDAPIVTVIPEVRRAKISWTTPAANGATIRAFRVTDESGRVVCSGTATTCDIQVNRSGQQVTFNVTAVTEDGTGRTGSASATLPRAVPGPLRNLKAEYVRSCKKCEGYDLVVSWDPPLDNGGSPITSVTWDAQRKIKSGANTYDLACTTKNGSETSCTWKFFGLSRPNIGISVTARNAVGVSAAAIIVAGAPAATDSAAPPQGPVDLAASQPAQGQSVLSWAYPTEVTDIRPNTHSVEVAECGRSCTQDARIVQQFNCDPYGLPGACVINGINPRNKHRVTVTARNANGATAGSLLLKAEASPTPPTAPSVPLSVSATDDVYSVKVSWSPPASEGTAPIEGYRVLHAWGAVACSVPATARSCSVEYANAGPRRIFVEAFSEDGAGPAASVTGHPRIPGDPGPPVRVGAVPGDGSVLIYWDSDYRTNQQSFLVLNASGSQTLCTAAGSATECTVPAVNGQETTFLVYARGGGKTSAGVRTNKVTPRTIPAVTSVEAATAWRYSTAATVTFAGITGWGFEPISYSVTMNPGGKTCTPQSFDLGRNFKCSIIGLTPGRYTVTVTASGSGSRSVSAPTPLVIVPTPPKPEPPREPRVTVSPSGLTVSWQPAANAAAAEITQYKVSTIGAPDCVVPANVRRCEFPNIASQSEWIFYLSSLNIVNESTGVSTGYVSTGPPRTPTGVRAEAVGGRDVLVSWDTDGRSIVEFASVRAIPGPGACAVTGTAQSCRITNVGLDSAQSFGVTLSNGAGASGEAQGGSIRLQLPGSPKDQNVMIEGDTAQVRWAAPDQLGTPALTRYVVTDLAGREVCATSETGCDIGGLANGTRVQYSIRAENPVGSSSTVTTDLLIIGAPNQPQALTLIQKGADVIASWQAPSKWGNGGTGRYELSSNAGTCSTTQTSCTLAKPPSGQDLSVAVRAVNTAGPSDAARSSIRVVGKPSRPVDVAVLPDDQRLLIEWSAPADSAANPVQSYRVSLLEFPFIVRDVCTVDADQLSCEVYGLENDRTYGVAISAINAAGMGPGSEPVFASPGKANDTAERPPSPARDVKVTYNESTRQVKVTWKPPLDTGGTRRPDYIVLILDQGLRGTGCFTRALSCTRVIPEEPFNRVFSVFVAAQNSAGPEKDPKPADASFAVPRN